MDQTMTFTVQDVREVRSGVTDGRSWTKYVITTETGAQLGTFDSSWLLAIGDTVSVPVREREYNGKTYVDVVGRPPGSAPKPAAPAKPAPSGRPAPSSRGQSVQTALVPQAALDAAVLERIETGVAQLTRRVDAMGAVLGDVTEAPRAIRVSCKRRGPAVSEDDMDAADDAAVVFDPEDPGPLEPLDTADELIPEGGEQDG